MSRRRSSRASTTAPVFPALPKSIQNGLQRLVEDNAETVAQMLDATDATTEVLCEKCAQVMKQQQLSPSLFLARFFAVDVLSQHAVLLGKSGKGSAATLGDRIEAAWASNKAIPLERKRKVKSDSDKETDSKEMKPSTLASGESETHKNGDRKRKSTENEGDGAVTVKKIPKKKEKS